MSRSQRPYDGPRASDSSGVPHRDSRDTRGFERGYTHRRDREYDHNRRSYDWREDDRPGGYRQDRYRDDRYDNRYRGDRRDDRYRREYPVERGGRYGDDDRSGRDGRDPYVTRHRSRSPPNRRSRSPVHRDERRPRDSFRKEYRDEPTKGAKRHDKADITRDVPKGNPKDKAVDDVEDDNPDDAMAAMLGISGFGTTKGKHIHGQLEGANVKTERTWRQYMNRKGGFNRVLDKV